MAICLAALIAACAPPGSDGPVYKIATATQRSGVMSLANAVGVLDGKLNADGTACFWLGGSALSWPDGYSARRNPLAVYDDRGNVVATVGQKVSMAGGLMSDNVNSINGCSDFTMY